MSFAPRPLTRLFAASTRSISQRAPSSQATRIKFSVGTNPFSPRLLLPSSSSNFPGQATFSQKRWATSSTPQTTSDPAEVEAAQCLEEGTQKLEEGDVNSAKVYYRRSVEIKRTASALFNLGVTHYHLKEFDEAISAWKESIDLQPSSADAHTNLASAYIISPIARPDLALQHLKIASSLAPDDPEIAFNLAAVLEACGRLEEALEHYRRSKDYGVDRAAMHIRNVSAKILGQKLKAEEEAAKKSGSS
ncbi:TPR-like protein [Stereum hirsutum FP-91666 SS1]|uniref:TPR-like protein n=1 Tax=Stereum hirsutum (strain FP-91666) TaxID=721885 RepID=R7S063_STEHR|nr:TPR-like protein [Stereum hirsutum FP-91666 SS1]EIM80503.1 TPR-like protein [Stereum hirsutum FP-91666 SS1]